MAANSSALSPVLVEMAVALMDSQKANINAALGARYLSFLGLSILVYDILLTNKMERQLMWRSSQWSFSHVAFYIHRYLTPISLFTQFIMFSGFIGLNLSDKVCRGVSGTTTMCALLSAAIGNILVLTKVVALWENDRRIRLLLFGSFTILYGSSIMVFSTWIGTNISSISYEPLLSMCVLTRAHPLLIPAWAAPLVFEVLILVTTYWNAVDRPRRITESLASTLRKDGMTLYAIMAILRVFSLALVATQDARLVLLSVFLVWALISLTVNRSLLSIRRAELDHLSGHLTPLPLTGSDPFGRKPTHSMVESLELRQVVETKWD